MLGDDKMFKEFDEYISEFLDEDFSSDFWYDVAAIKASEMMGKFNQSDWDVLFQELNNKSLERKKKLAYCIENSESGNELKALLIMIDTTDDELSQMCVDSMKIFVIEQNKELFLKNEALVKHINRLMISSNDITKKVYQDFISKLNS